MATYLTSSILLMGFILTAIAAVMPSRNGDLVTAIEEMRTANYFSFVMLINMLPPEKVPRHITFLMPSDLMLSHVSLPENLVHQFLLRHSIPSPLLFDHLKHFPTGSMIPTSEPDFLLRVSNKGTKIYLNNIQIISANICIARSSIRCHGINGVLGTPKPKHNTTAAPPPSSPASP